MKKFFLFSAIFFFLADAGHSQFQLGGSYENDIAFVIRPGGSPTLADVNRLRLKVDYDPGSNFTVHLEPRYYCLIKTEDIPLIGVTDMDKVVWDRYYAKAFLPLLSVTAGKQRIAWGTGYIWNPTDIFNTYVLSFAITDEEKINVEAVRLEIPLGQASGLDGWVLTGPSQKKGLRAKTTLGLFDLGLSYVDRADGTSQAGLAFAGDAWLFGVRGEVVVLSGSRQMLVMLGSDYTFDNGVGLSAEYFYNGLGQSRSANYDWTSYYAGAIPALARDYLYLGTNKILDELTTVNFSLLANLNDESFIFYPSYARSLAQNLDIYLQASIVGGRVGSEFYPPPSQDPTGFAGSKLLLMKVKYSF